MYLIEPAFLPATALPTGGGLGSPHRQTRNPSLVTEQMKNSRSPEKSESMPRGPQGQKRSADVVGCALNLDTRSLIWGMSAKEERYEC